MSQTYQSEAGLSQETLVSIPNVANLVDNPNAPELLIDGFIGIQNQNGLLKLTAFSDRIDPST